MTFPEYDLVITQDKTVRSSINASEIVRRDVMQIVPGAAAAASR